MIKHNKNNVNIFQRRFFILFISVEEIDRLIKEDVPYLDLTSFSLGINAQKGRISYLTRDDAIVCGTEEVKLIFERLNIKTERFIVSGETVKSNDELICGVGRGCDIHMAWKVGQNILEHCCAIATKTRKMVLLAKKYNPNVAILTTRKGFPGTKYLAIKAIMAGGAMPHRLGLSETVLIFKQHIDFIGGFDALIAKIPALKTECCEKKVIVETCSYDEAEKLCEAGVDAVQFDKVSSIVLKDIVAKLKRKFPKVVLLAAGGINENNVAEYAGTYVDGIVTTSLYHAKPIDIGVNISLL
jgi:molybdenum transport protein